MLWNIGSTERYVFNMQCYTIKKKLHPKAMTLEILLEFPIGYRQRGVFYIICRVSSEVICLVDVPSKCTLIKV
jgi:hypothetical protein